MQHLRLIWNLSHWQGKKNTFIQNELKKWAVDFSLDKIKRVLTQMNSWKHSTLKANGFLHKRWDTQLTEEQRVALSRGMPDEFQIRGRGRSLATEPLAGVVPAAMYFEEKKDKRTVYDTIMIISATDCEYCTHAKATGIYDKVLKKIKNKWAKRYHIKEVTTVGNPLTLFKAKETRELAMYFTHQLGIVPTIFDIYFPCLFMMSHTNKVMAQFRVGIRVAQLPHIIELIHTEHLFPAPFGYLSPEMHTSKYLETYGAGVKKLYRQVGLSPDLQH